MMDKEYIRMCREAKEIQDAWEGKPGDAFYVPSKYEKGYGKLEAHIAHLSEGVALFKTKGDLKRLREEYQKLNYVWLPRQEDLQEIAKKHPVELPYDLLEEFLDWFNGDLETNYACDITNLWLCFVMETVYNKRWNGERKKWELIK